MIELITLILEDGCFAQYSKTVSKSTRHKKLTVIVFSKFNCDVLTISRASLSNINGDIQNGTFDATDQLALGIWRALKVQTSHYTVRRHTLIILDKCYFMPKDWNHLLIKFSLGKTFEEIATMITKYFGLNYQYPFYSCLNNFHNQL